ncbi:MAG: 2-nitropropane dioxygenase [Blastopirellula sp.]|nr:MAG: 2-nitropropane dioxygenase [Blastopirellula sp.]
MIIQGGMGVAVSSWKLASAVSKTGQLGVVSGTALDVVLARRLQLGDPAGEIRHAMDQFPCAEMVARILDRYFVSGGKLPESPFRSVPLATDQLSRDHLELLVVSNFVEVLLAKQGHEGVVGINFLEKIQLPMLPSLFGAMLAGVDYVLMGAGIPKSIPGVLDQLSQGKPAELNLDIQDAPRDKPFVTRFDPAEFWDNDLSQLQRPRFLAIVSSVTLATVLARKASGHVDGFVIEGPSAGGHNAPPRGAMQLNDRGEPIYGKRDLPDLEAIKKLGRPFWLAGSYGTPERLAEALDLGAVGVQVGTAFAFCEESGFLASIKRDVINQVRQEQASVFTDPQASPTGFPFKVLELPDTLSDDDCFNCRKSACDLGYLRRGYQREDGTVGWRCPAENVETYIRKGGDQEDTLGRKCICNALFANIGLAQVRASGQQELPLVTCGDDLHQIMRYLSTPDADGYSAESVVSQLLAGLDASELDLRSKPEWILSETELPVT